MNPKKVTPAPPITIQRVQNGWIVETAIARACISSMSDQHVFESWDSLVDWLNTYYFPKGSE